MENKSVKELVELLEGLAVVGEKAAEAGKDGFQVSDLAKAIELLEKHQVLIDAVKGLGDIQLSDVKLADAGVIIAKVIELAQRIKAKL